MMAFQRKTAIFAVALIASTIAAVESVNMCVFQKNTVVEEYKLSFLDHMMGEILITESNDNVYVVSICRPVQEMFYDPRKLTGAIKLTAEGNTIDLGRINQSNVIVNENSIVLTYVGGDRDTDVGDTCKGMRWTTYLTFICDPLATHDILTLIDEDPDQPEICQVWFEIKTSKTCNRHPRIPLVVLEKDFSTFKNQIDHEKYSVRDPTNFNDIPSRKNAFDYETINFFKNNKYSNIENKENLIINDLDNKFNKSLSNEKFSTSKENKTTNEEIKNGNSTQIISKDQKKQWDNENKDYYLNKYNKSINEKKEKEEAKGDYSKTNTSEDKMSANHENNKLWIKTNMPHHENQKHYPSNDLENKFANLKINNTVPDISSNKEYSYPEKNATILHYNDLKKYLNQNKNSEGKYENSVMIESAKYDENKDDQFNQDVPKDASNNDIKHKMPIDSEKMEKTSRQNTFENITSYKELNDSGDNKKPSDNENKLNQDNSKKSNLNDFNLRTYNKTLNTDNGVKHKAIDEGKIVNVSNQSQSNDNKSIIYNNKVPDDEAKEKNVNHTLSQNNNTESNSFQKADQKNEIEKNSRNVNGSVTESTPRDNSKNKPTGNEDKGVDANNNNITKSITYDNKVPGDVAKENDANQTRTQNNNTESNSFQKADQKNEIENNSKNVNGSVTESTPRDNSENKPTGNEDKGVDANNNSTKSITYDNKVPGDVAKENDANQTRSQNNNTESNSFQKVDQKNEIENNSKYVNGSVTESTPRDNSENKSTGNEDKGVDANNINNTKNNANDDNVTINANEKNKMKNNINSTSGSDDSTTAITVKPTTNSPSNTTVNDNTNKSGELNGSSTESPVDQSLNNIKTNDKSESNGTIINGINNVKQNLQPDQSIPVSSSHSSDDNKSDDLKTTTNSMNQSEDGFSFDKLFSNIFPNGLHVSATTIVGALASLTAVTGVVGTAINRYYYKLSGTDQIPFKGTFQSIFNSIKVILITTFCCCCRGGGENDLEAPDSTNEKTPLLKPKYNTSTPLIVDETSQKSKKRNKRSDDGKQQNSDSADNDDSSKQKSNNEYGSMSNERKSSTSETKYSKIKRKSKISDTNLSDSTSENESLVKNVKEKLINIENNLQGKSIKEVISGKINTIFTEKVKPTIDSIIEKVGNKVESTEEIKKNLDIITKDAALISKFVENEKSKKDTDDFCADIEIKTENNSKKAHLNEIETHNGVVQEQIKSITLDESQQSPDVKPMSEVIVSKVSIPTLNKQDIVMKNNIEKLQDTVVTSLTDTKAKINESKLKFLGLEKEDKNVQKVVTDESIANDKKIENEEDESVEVIEEVIYIDGADGEEGEEIIEEIIETTTIEDSPDPLDESGAGSGHTKVTVRTTRKISSSSLPGEVKTIEETVVTDGIPEKVKKTPGFQFGVGKSGVSMSVGDQKLEIGKSGLKLNRSKSKSPKNVEGDEPDKRDTKSPEKSKKSMSLPKIFKRSISQPTDDDIIEAEGELQSDSASTKKLSRTGSGLLKFGKSRSKSTVVLKTGDVTIDTDMMSNFINNERNASRKSSVGPGEFDITVGDADVAPAVVVRKTSTTTSVGKDTPASMDNTAEISSIDLGVGSAKDQKSAKNGDTKSNAKTKREKKGKTKLTTLTRPF